MINDIRPIITCPKDRGKCDDKDCLKVNGCQKFSLLTLSPELQKQFSKKEETISVKLNEDGTLNCPLENDKDKVCVLGECKKYMYCALMRKKEIAEGEKVLSKSQQEENTVKYGDKNDDIIAQAYKHSKETGDTYCAFNAKKYITRFISKSKKAGNTMDLRKAIDYLNRMIEQNIEKKEVIEK